MKRTIKEARWRKSKKTLFGNKMIELAIPKTKQEDYSQSKIMGKKGDVYQFSENELRAFIHRDINKLKGFEFKTILDLNKECVVSFDISELDNVLKFIKMPKLQGVQVRVANNFDFGTGE